MTKKTRTRRVISLLCALLMIITLLPMHVASAAATPYYLTLLAVAGGDGDYVVNCADVGTATLKQSDVFNFEGWVYSTVKFSSYTITFAKGNNPPSKTVEAKVENFPFPEDFKANVKANTKKTYTVENSKWSASVKLSDLSTGTWTVMVKGRVVGDANSTYDIAKVTLTIKATGTGPNNYAVCNDAPNPNAVKQYTKNGPSKVTISKPFVYGNTTSFNVSGWAIHDRGIDSYSYTIKDKSTGAIVYGKENKYISALDRSDLGPTAKSLRIATGNNTYHTWYNGSIYIAGMAAGTYVAYVRGKTLDGQTFPVAEITFTIQNGSITAKEGNVTVTKISAPESGITRTLTIQANGDGGNWKVSSNQSWATVTPDIKNKKLTIKVNASNATTTRTATITLSCGGTKHVITVTQSPKTVINHVTKELDFKYWSTDEVIYKGKCYYSDGYFTTPATKYNSSLSTMSMCLAMSAFAPDNAARQYENVEELLGKGKCEFLNVEANEDYKNVPNENTMGVIIGHKEITTNEGKVTLIVLVTRGAGYHNEWAGNFNVGSSGNHEGFRLAKDKAKSFLDDYVDKYKNSFNSNVKLWVTGYSRGAATVNLLAGEITASGKIGKNKTISISKENIYAYCFEPPRGLHTSVCPEANAVKYKNIHNIVNPDDFVPEVAMEGWGFIRYGVDEEVIPNIKTDGEYLKHVNNMMTYYKAIGGDQRKKAEAQKKKDGKDPGNIENSMVSLSEYESHMDEVLEKIFNYGIYELSCAMNQLGGALSPSELSRYSEKMSQLTNPEGELRKQIKSDYLLGKTGFVLENMAYLDFRECPGFGMFSNAYAYRQGLLRMKYLQGVTNSDAFSKVNLFHLRKFNGPLRTWDGLLNVAYDKKSYSTDYSVTQGEVINNVLQALTKKLKRSTFVSQVQPGLYALLREYFRTGGFFEDVDFGDIDFLSLVDNKIMLAVSIVWDDRTVSDDAAKVFPRLMLALVTNAYANKAGKQLLDVIRGETDPDKLKTASDLVTEVLQKFEQAFTKNDLQNIKKSLKVLSQGIVEIMADKEISDGVLSLAFSADTIGMAHYPELCFAWLQSLDPKYGNAK